jgi:hypothetical protein
MSYRDITVDLDQPTTVTDWTATVVLDTLRSDATGEVFTSDISDAVELHPEADVGEIASAVKALRNLGHCITTTKARHLSWYTLAQNVEQVEAHHQRMAEQQYSERVSWVRSMEATASAVGPSMSPIMMQFHSEGVMQAMALGRLLGKAPVDVVEDCKPLMVV